MKMYILVMLGIMVVLSKEKVDISNKKVDAELTLNIDNQEKDNMKREFCKVIENRESFVLENTIGELYFLETSLNSGFNEGEEVVLIYKERNRIRENIYEADVYAIYSDSSEVKRLTQ